MSRTTNYLSRHGNELAGIIVLLAVALFGVALTQSGRLQDWFNPGQTLRILLPQAGLLGLTENASVDILGTAAGQVTSIVIDGSQALHAEVSIRAEYVEFVRSDSQAVIRKRFGVAGDSYLDITRGFGDRLDWEFAVLEATADRAPTDLMTELVEELRDKVLPTLDSAQATVLALARLSELMADPNGDFLRGLGNLRSLTDRIERGEGPVGRLLNDSTLVTDIEKLVADTRTLMEAAKTDMVPVLSDLRSGAASVATMGKQMSQSTKELPAIIARVDDVLSSLDTVLVDVKKTTPELPRLARGLADSTDNLPTLLLQTQNTAAELERLVEQLRGTWLLGGEGATGEPPSRRLSPLEVSP